MNTILTTLFLLVNEKLNCDRHFVYEKKNCQYLYQRSKVKLCVCSETLNGNNFQKIYGKICSSIIDIITNNVQKR